MTALFVVEEWRFILELICAEFIFVTPSAQKRDHFWLRCAGGIVFCVCFSLLYYFLTLIPFENFVVRAAAHIGWYSTLTVLSLCLIVFCYHISFGWVLFCGIGGYALQHVEYVAVNEMFALGIFPQINNYIALYVAIIVGTYAALCACAGLLFRRKLRTLGDLPFADNFPSLCFYSLLLVMLIASAFMAQTLFLNNQPKYELVSPNYTAGIADIFNCVFVLIILYAFCCVRERDRRNDIVNQMLINSKEQYRLKKETIDIINGKCHNLKHQIAALRRMSEEEREERISEIEKRIMFYDFSVDTGNEVINTILAEKMLYCTENGIRLYVSGSGKRLDFMDVVDLYTLLGNALDNAVESVMAINDAQKKIIHFSLSEQGDILFIRTDNYYEGKISFRDGLPLTSKANEYYHGFGMASIRRIVEKYEGSLAIGTDGGIFTLQLVLPCPRRGEKCAAGATQA